jgi:hypothetical protein
MNPLESLKVKLRIKPVVEEHEKIAVVVPLPTSPEKVELSKVTIIDERGTDTGFNREMLFTKLQEQKLNKTVVKPTVKLSAVQEDQEKEEPQKKKAKKIAKKILFQLQEEGVPIVQGKEEGNEDQGEEKEAQGEEKEETVEEIGTKKRRTKRPTKGVILVPPEEWVDIDKVETISRLPPKKPHVNIKVSSYFLTLR